MTTKTAEEKELADELVHGDLKSSADPTLKPMGDVMIEIPFDQPFNEDVSNILTSLESKGWNVMTRTWWPSESFEDSSEGVDTGRPVIGTGDATNNIINGVSLPLIDESSTYKVVKIIRPEDRVEGGDSGILYLMNGHGDVKEYMENEGFLIIDDTEKLHHALAENTP